MRYILTLCLSVLSTSVLAAGSLLTPLPHMPKAPDFSLSDLDNHSHTLSNYQGKVVVLNFWATWCPPCRAEMPSMQRAWEVMRDEDMLMLAVNVGEREALVREFSQNMAVSFPMLLDDQSSIMRHWPARGLPTTFVIDPQGRIAYRAIGERRWDRPEILNMLRALKNSAKSPIDAGHEQEALKVVKAPLVRD